MSATDDVRTARPPVVSVVMPVFNSRAYLARAVESILGQTLASIELIIVDDGSTDGSDDVARRFAEADDRVRLIAHEENRGNYPCRNEGLEAARGEFFAVMDSDDVSLPSRLERQVDFLRRRPECVLVGSRVLKIDPEGFPIGRMPGIPLEHGAIDAALMDKRWAIVHPSATMRKRAVDDVGRYRARFRTCADHDLYLRLAEIGRLANLPDVLLHYRQHYGSLTRLQSDQRHNLDLIQREALRRRGLPLSPTEGPVPVKEATPIAREQKRRLRFQWARDALRHGFVLSAAKNFAFSLALDPAGALAGAAGRLRNRMMRSTA